VHHFVFARRTPKENEIALEAFLIMAVLVGVIPLGSAVHKADHGAIEVPLNGANVRN
jgi:hypothetical protein